MTIASRTMFLIRRQVQEDAERLPNDKRRIKPHPVMKALEDLGVKQGTLGYFLDLDDDEISNMAQGRVVFGQAVRKELMALLAEAVLVAEAAEHPNYQSALRILDDFTPMSVQATREYAPDCNPYAVIALAERRYKGDYKKAIIQLRRAANREKNDGE